MFNGDSVRISLDAPAQPNEDTLGGNIIPQNALDQNKLFEPAKYEVIEYLKKSFFLPDGDAAEVYLAISQKQ
jgi:hypothetical protein